MSVRYGGLCQDSLKIYIHNDISIMLGENTGGDNEWVSGMVDSDRTVWKYSTHWLEQDLYKEFYSFNH